MGSFDDLVPKKNNSSNNFSDLIPNSKPENSENILQRAASNMQNPSTKTLSPVGIGDMMINPLMNAPRLGLSAMGIPEENIMPMAGQVVGGITGGFPGAVAGEGIGEIARQGGKFSRGQNITPQDIPTGMGITAVTEGIPRTIFNSYFGRQIASKAMEKAGQAVGAVKDALASDPTAEVPSGPIVSKLQSIYDGIKTPLKDQASHIKDWIDHLSSSHMAHATDLQQMEDSFGAYSKYGSYENGAYQPPKSTEPVINRATKAARDVVSNAHDELAVQKGFTDFPEQSKEFSSYKQRWKDINPARDKVGFMGKLGVGLLAGKEFGPTAGLGTYLAENVLTNPAFKGAAFNVINNPIVNAALSGGRLAGAELGRDITRNSS